MYIATNPTTGDELHRYEILDNTSLGMRIEASAKSYSQWRKTSFAQRATLLKQVAEIMRTDVERLAQLMTDEMGKPIKEARAEVLKSALCADHYAEQGRNIWPRKLWRLMLRTVMCSICRWGRC